MAAEDPAGEDERTVASPARSRSGEPKLPQGGLAAGEHVGRYVIREAMAEGGMGVVYLARDPELDRDVAIKLIRPGADADPLEAGARLLREAQAMARLSHPNVVVIHDVGTAAGGGVFLAMEYVKGTTLRAWLADRERSWREIIDAFVAAGRGLAAAHAAGVIHRDFKPDNVLVRSDDGRVQVTDFGLARDAAVEEQLPSEPVRQISQGILALSVTVTGDVLGTPRYMAPEQHQRTATDAATDQFSYAVALYSALCGRHPFGDVKDAGFVARVLEGKPAPPSTHLPARVRNALVRALDRSPDRRFPTLDALLAELTPRPSRTWLWVLAAIAVGLAIVLATRRGSAPHTGLKVARSVPLTRDADLQLDPALSPDGHRLAYASGQFGHMRIVVKLDDGPPIELSKAIPGDHRWPQWSPDGTRLLFQAAEAGFESRYRTYIVNADGTGAQLLIEPPGKSAAMAVWSPDGSSIAYVQSTQDWNPPWEIVTVRFTERGVSDPKVLFQTDRHTTFSTPSWSPDGTRIAFSQGNASFFLRGNIAPASLWMVAADGSEPAFQITSGQWLDHAPFWTRDGRGLLFVSDRDGTSDVYELEVDARGAAVGKPERLTVGLHAHTIAIAGNRVVCAVFSYRTNLWAVPLPATGEATLADARALTTGNQIVESVDPSPDGTTIAFDSNRSGNQDIYVMPAAGGEPIAVTSDPANDFAPGWSPDGKRLAYHSFRTGTRNIFVSDRDGSHVEQITQGTFNHWNPRWSPDGKTLVLYADRAGEWAVWTVPAAGGEPSLIVKGAVPRWSRDGNQIGYTDREGLWLVDRAGGKPRLLVRAPEIVNHNWSVDGSTIYFRRNTAGHGTIWAVPATGGEPRLVLRLEDPVRHPDRVEFAVDAERLILPLTEHDADLWSIELAN